MTGDVWLRTGPRIFARTDHRPFRSKLGISRTLHLQSPRYLAPPLEPAYAWNYAFLLAASSALAQLGFAAEENPTCRTTTRLGAPSCPVFPRVSSERESRAIQPRSRQSAQTVKEVFEPDKI